MRFKNMKIKTKLTLSFSLVIFIFASALVTGVMQINSISVKSGNVYTKEVLPLETLLNLRTAFGELRRSTTVVAMRGALGNQEDIEAAIKTAEDKYEALKASGTAYLEKMTDINEPTQNYEAAKALLTEIDNIYWPVIQKIYVFARADDIEQMMNNVVSATSIAAGLEDGINSLYDEKMAAAASNTEDISTVSQRAMLVLGAIGIIAIAISFITAILIGSSISKRIVLLSGVSKEIAKGNLRNNIDDNSADELGDLARDLKMVSESVITVTSSLGELTDKFRNGIISAKADTTELNGVYKEIAEEVNVMFATVISDVLSFFKCVDEFGEGNFDATVDGMVGEKVVMSESLDSIRKKLKSAIGDINGLVAAASQGRLSNRIDVAQYNGDWAKMMDSLNRLMEAVSMPISEVEAVLSVVAKGDFNNKIAGDYSGDFLMIKTSVNNMIDNIYSYIAEISETLTAVTDNKLDRLITREYVGEFTKIKDSLNSIIGKFNEILSEISASSDQVAMGSKHVSESSIALSEGTTEQAASVEELSATIQNISEATSSNAESAKEAENLSERSKENAAKGDLHMKKMLASMEGIKESSKSISKIIKVIDDIAFQTNILALNAAVEGARAGVHGKGFSVVAEEVRNLAGRSQQAAKETSNLIEESINRVKEGTNMADLTASALQTIVEDVTKTARIITQISDASQAQASALSQVTEGLTLITDVVQTNSATSEEAASAAEELYSQSEMLKGLVKVFQLRKR